jgi:hypothetical protein
MPRKRYGVRVGTSTQYLYFSANVASYTGLLDDLGLKDVDGEGFDGSIDRINTRSKFRSRVALRYQFSPTESRVVRLWCATSSLSSALSSLAGKQYKGKDIIDAYIPNRYGVG